MKRNTDKYYCLNRKANFEYFIVDKYEAGIVLFGDEVKSIRKSAISITEGFISITDDDQLILHATHISILTHGFQEFEPIRDRKLLMGKDEICKLGRKVKEKGYTLIPYNVYPKRGLIKVTVALAKGKQKHDKREDIKKRDQEREMRSGM